MNTSLLLETAQTVNPLSYWEMLMKGGLILLPLAFLSLLAIYIIIDRTIALNRMGKYNTMWLSQLYELIASRKIEKARKFALNSPYSAGKVIAAGLRQAGREEKDIEDAMQLAAREQTAKMEHLMNYLGITASIAPMLGFLGTIFGVISIFYNVSQSGNLDIASISDGLYQKMICSGVGLLVGVVAYTGFYILNGVIDKAVLRIDRAANEALNVMKSEGENAFPSPYPPVYDED
jgi:biopolymer transport protein ExbB